ncbi:MAG: type I DNA topoisomerase [Hyphomicrobiaceae bacterium]|nr:MAG: type I DNA topoisomerase [Hyphomicrobiaceae bacterium]
MNVVIVESAAKAKAINKYLGSGYKVIASYGHVRDLPSKDGSVEPDKDFEMHWDLDGKSAKVMKEIADAVKKADKLILATDPDREGEAISWHILRILEERRALKKGLPVERVTFNAVTKQSVLAALAEPRQIDAPLVEAYLARRALDYLVGFTLSPVLWRKLPGARSAGRVQSVALRLVCDREAEIEAFKTEEYWTIEALLTTAKGEEVRARLTGIAGRKLDKLDIKDSASANAIKAAIEGSAFTVASVEKKAVRRNPYAPFTTSTLQQDASRKLGFSAKHTMQVAQRLYEGVDIGGETVGLITYMRTDGVTIIPEAISAIRKLVEQDFSKRYLPPFIREYKTKAKNAQEAHEAIRPTDVRRKPDQVARYLERDQARLYDLIWKRSVASQMASAELEQTTVEIEAVGRDGKTYGLRASGSVVTFDGFLKLYEEGRDDRVRNGKAGDATEDDADSRRLPPLAQGDALKDREIEALQHFTEPPPRFTEATLVKRMEELGIGRPSTYASTLAVLEDRGYVAIDKKRLVPEDKGRLVTAFLESFFERYVEYDFTADLEEKLDLISDGKLEWKDVLRDFWRDFMGSVEEIKDLRVGEVLEALNEILGPHIFPARADGGDPRQCPNCGEGRLSLKVSGKYGAFIGCSRYPDCRYTRQLSQPSDGPAEASTPDGKLLGHDPETGLPVTLRTGRFGPYVQLGEGSKDEKPKRASVPKGVDANTIDIDYALKLLSLPRLVGGHPETGKPITAGLGRFGPFILHDGTYANLPTVDEVFSVGINRAVVLLAEKKAGGGKGRFQRAAPTVLKELGEHPSEGGKVQVLSGRYGPYVKHGDINATLPKGKDPATLSLDDAVLLIAERAAKGPSKARGRRVKAAKPKVEAGATKKPASGKAAKRKAPKEAAE